MAEHFSFFDPVQLPDGTYDREYNAQQFTAYLGVLVTTGIINGEGDMLAVSANGSNMVTKIDNGVAFIEAKYYKNDGFKEHTHDTETLGNSRIDRIVIRMDLSTEARHVKSFVKKGAPSPNPVPPVLTQTENIYEISLAQVRVVGGQTFIATNAVIDERGKDIICPWAGSNILPSFDDNALAQLERVVATHLDDDKVHLKTGERDKIDNALQPSTYSDGNMIMNLGDGYATRAFPVVIWENNNSTELLEFNMPLQHGINGILELDLTSIFAHSNASGGAKIVFELGVGDDVYLNQMKIMSMSSRFADNFYVKGFEFRKSGDHTSLLLQIYKRSYANPLRVRMSLLTAVGGNTAYRILAETHHSRFDVVPISEQPQKDLDARITENFTLVSNGKAVVNQAVTDMGVYTPPDAPFATTAANVRMLSTGASGNGNATNNGARTVFSVSGLKFAPRVINISFTSGNNRIVYNRSVNQNVDAFIHVGGAWHNYSASIQLTDSGFTITVATPLTGPYRWEAFK